MKKRPTRRRAQSDAFPRKPHDMPIDSYLDLHMVPELHAVVETNVRDAMKEPEWSAP